MGLQSRIIAHVLTEGYLTSNGQGFLRPLIVNRSLLRERGIKIKFFSEVSPELLDCSHLLIDSKFFRYRWGRQSSKTLDTIAELGRQGAKVLWFHTGDSAGGMGSYSSDIMPLVQGFLKSQVYVDKTMYQRKLYGNRLFTDYYHTEFGIEDSEVAETDPVIRSADLSKIGVSWNIGYARCFDFYGEYLAGAYKRLPLSVILRLRPSFRSARKLRRQRVYSRMGLNFPRETIGFQRKAMADLLGKQSRVSRWDYYKQMRDSQVVISPFGWGEINNRDFEAFTAGCILVKPSVDHLETFPNWFIKGETYVPYKWDMSDMSGILDDVVTKYSQYQDIAISAQELYQDCVFSREGRQAFVDHFKVLLGF